jgi:hypothetical protein
MQMREAIPLARTCAPLRHSTLVPAWNDKFDMRPFFSCIHPAHYALKEGGELEHARYLFGLTQMQAVAHVSLFRSTLKAHRRCPRIFQAAAQCLEIGKTWGYSYYQQWFKSPNDQFDHQAPQGWFTSLGFPELAEELELRQPLSGSEIMDERPLAVPGHPSATVFLDRERTERTRQGEDAEQREVLRIARFLFAVDGWEDEFDPCVHFAMWSPLLNPIGDDAATRSAFFIFDVMRTQFVAWLRLYRAALRAGCEQTGVLAAVCQCAQQMVVEGGEGYPEWFETPISGFANLTPRQWLRTRRLFHLEQLLDLGRGPT